MSVGQDLLLFIDSRSPLPLHVQLKEQFKFLILKGDIAPGTRLPATRSLASFLRINRNTVAGAYQELVRESLVEARRGRGCYVRAPERSARPASEATAALLKLIDDSVSQAADLGVTPAEFAAAAYVRARTASRKLQADDRPVVFVECQPAIAESLARQLAEALSIPVTAVSLSELKDGKREALLLARKARIIATTFFHVAELKRLFRHANPEIVGLVVKPHLDGLLRVSQIDRNARVLLVCLTTACAGDMARSLENAGLKGPRFDLAGVDDPDRLQRSIERADVIVASQLVCDGVEPMVNKDRQTLVALDYSVIDDAAAAMLKARLEGLQGDVG